MEKVVITLDENVAAWGRQQAARRNVSLSRFVGELIEKTMSEASDYENAMLRFLFRKPSFLKRSHARYRSRDELYDRGRLR